MKKTSIMLGLAVACICLTPACTTAHHIDLRNYETSHQEAKTQLIPRSVLFGNPDRGQVRLSPDGQYVSWLAPVGGALNIWVAPIDDMANAKPVTQEKKRGIYRHRWGYDSRYVLYRKDKDGDENYHIYATDIVGGTTRDLTPVKDGVRATIEARSAQYPNRIIVGINERDPAVFDLYMVDVNTGERSLLKINPGYAGWVIDQSLTPRYGYETPKTGGARIVDFDGNTFMDIPIDDYLTTEIIGFDASNRYLHALDSRGRNTSALVRIDTQDGAVTTLAQDSKADVQRMILHPKTNEPLAYSVEYMTEKWEMLDPELSADFDFLTGRFNGAMRIVSKTDDLSKFIVYSSEPDKPSRYYTYDKKSGSVDYLFSTRPDLQKVKLQPMHAIEIKARDGLPLVSYLTLPTGSDADGDGRPEKPVPLIVSVHGGPWGERDKYSYDPSAQWLANRGYAVLSINFRGSGGFGKAFLNAARRQFAGEMHDDLIDGVNWAIAERIADKNKIGITGGSYGGYATLVGLTFTPDVFACGAARVAPSNLVTLIESFPDYAKPYLDSDWYKFVGNPEIAAERSDMLQRSPITRIDAMKSPLLISHGANDPRVTKAESDTIVKKMEEKNLTVTYANFPDEGHGFSRPENVAANYAVTEHFFAKCLGGRAEPFADVFDGSSIEILSGLSYIDGLADALEQHSVKSKTVQ